MQALAVRMMRAAGHDETTRWGECCDKGCVQSDGIKSVVSLSVKAEVLTAMYVSDQWCKSEGGYLFRTRRYPLDRQLASVG